MTRFAIDAATALRIVREGVDVGEHQLVGVAGLRSQAMRLLYAEARAGDTITGIHGVTRRKKGGLGFRPALETAQRDAEAMSSQRRRSAA